MKTVTFRLPGWLIREIENEARTRRVSKSNVVRDRLQAGSTRAQSHHPELDTIADLVGSIDGARPDLSARRKAILKATGYGRKRPR